MAELSTVADTADRREGDDVPDVVAVTPRPEDGDRIAPRLRYGLLRYPLGAGESGTARW